MQFTILNLIVFCPLVWVIFLLMNKFRTRERLAMPEVFGHVGSPLEKLIVSIVKKIEENTTRASPQNPRQHIPPSLARIVSEVEAPLIAAGADPLLKKIELKLLSKEYTYMSASRQRLINGLDDAEAKAYAISLDKWANSIR